MRQKKWSRFWKNIFKFLFYPVGIAVFFLVISVLPGKLIRINKIECVSQYGGCPSEINSKFEALNFNQISKIRKRIQKLLDEEKMVSDYQVQYLFPDKLKVNILLKKARFAVLPRETEMYLLFDKEGQLLGKTKETSLPTVYQSGETPNLFALFLMEGVFKMYQVNRGEIVGRSLVVELPGAKRVRFPLEGDRDLLLGSLRLIYPEVDRQEIDLRFKNPVLR